MKNKKIAVVFPGVGYHADKPLLYYSRKLAAQYVRGVKAKPVKSHCIERLDQKRAVVSFQDFISLFADPDRTSGYLQFNEKRHPPVNEGENLR